MGVPILMEEWGPQGPQNIMGRGPWFEYGDPGSPKYYEIGDGGPWFHMKMGTQGPYFGGSPFSYDTGMQSRACNSKISNAGPL